MKTKGLFIYLILNVSFGVFGQGKWSKLDLSQAKVGMGVCAHDDRVYFAGGLTAPNGVATDRVEIYDETSETWSMVRLSQARGYAGAVAHEGNLYFGGGLVEIANPPRVYSTVDIYNSATGTWQSGNLSKARFNAAAVAHGRQVLFAGGADLSLNTAYATVDIYRADTDTWSVSSLSEPRLAMGSTVGGGKAFFGGGFDLTKVTNRVDIYNFETGEWSIDSLSEARGFVAAVTISGKVVFAGGMRANNTPSDVVDIYDLATGNWSTSRLSEARAFFTDNADTACHKAFFAGGGSFDLANKFWIAGSASNRVDVYDAISNTWSSLELSHKVIEHSVVSNGNRVYFAGGSDMQQFYFTTVDVYSCDPSTSIGQWSPTAGITLYPNPSSVDFSFVKIESSQMILNPVQIMVYNSLGQIMHKAHYPFVDSTPINLPLLPSGLYWVSWQEVGKRHVTIPWIVQ